MARNTTPKPTDPVDDKDYISGWTVQQGAAPEAPETVPGNVVTYDELPWKESLEKAGIVPEQYQSGLVIAKDPAEKAVLLHETATQREADGATPIPTGETKDAATAPAPGDGVKAPSEDNKDNKNA